MGVPVKHPMSHEKGALRPLRSRRPTEWKIRDYRRGLILHTAWLPFICRCSDVKALPFGCFAALTSETAGRYFVIKQYEGY